MKLLLTGTLLFFMYVLIPENVVAQITDSTEYLLYPTEVPNSKVSRDEKVDFRKKGGRFVSKIITPTLTYFAPENPKNKAIIICPGGGYRGLAIDKEGYKVARILSNEGYHAFVLKYRCPDDSLQYEKSIVPIQDAQRALIKVDKILKTEDEGNIHIGMMGFSAGGHLASFASNFNQSVLPEDFTKGNTTLKPAFSILIYPVISMYDEITHMGSRNNLLGENPDDLSIDKFSSDKLVSASTPPTFIVHASDDKSVDVKNSLNYYKACISHDIPVEMHIYAHGGHGFGLNNPTTTDAWIERLLNWLLTI